MTVTPAVALVEGYRVHSATVAGKAAQASSQAFRLLLDPMDDKSFSVYAAAMARVVNGARADASALGGAFYLAHREASGILGDIPAVAWQGSVNPVALNTSLLVTGPVSVRRALSQGVPMEQALRAAESRTAGAVYRHTTDAGRFTIAGTALRDPKAEGWARMTDGRPCPFCAMLAGRGAVYKSATTAGLAHESHKYHDKCGCFVVPVYDRSGHLPGIGPDLAGLWDSTRDANGHTNFARFREAYVKAYPPGANPGQALASSLQASAERELAAAARAEQAAAAAVAPIDADTVRTLTNADVEARMQAAWDAEDWQAADLFESEVDRRNRVMQAWGRTYDDFEPLDISGLADEDLPDFEDIPQRRLTVREIRSEWEADMDVRYWDAEQYGGGIRPDLRAEANAKGITLRTLFEGDPRIAYKYANPELLQWWEMNGGRRPLFEALAAHGRMSGAKLAQKRLTEDKARAMAQEALGRNRSEYLAERAAEAQARRSRRVLSLSDKLAAEQKRYQRATKAAANRG